MSFLSALFGGGDIVKSVGDVVDKFVTTDEERMELEAEIAKTKMNYDMEMKKLSVQEKQLLVEDVSSARSMQAETQTSEHASPLAKNIVPVMAILTTLLTFGLFFWVMTDDGTIARDKKDIVLYILGVLSALTTQIYSFYFGSSQGSSDKNKMLEKMRTGGKG